MNGLALRISRGSDSKSKKSIGFSPVNISISSFKTSDKYHELFQKFADATSTDEQLPILRKIVDLYRDAIDTDIIKFMVVVFLQAEAKHPLKCFIARHVTKNSNLQEPFTSVLASQISTRISVEPTHYKEYEDVVSKVATCIENFNAGVAAVRIVEIELGTYLMNCLDFCVDLLLSESKTLSPTEKNEIFTLSHITLRLLLHIVQKANDESLSELIPLFIIIELCIKDLMMHNDVPMDTKSVCGILFISMYIVKNGPDSWLQVLNPSTCNDSLLGLLEAEASQLCLYSALITVVSVDKLEAVYVKGDPAILSLLSKILEIGERSSLESTVILGVARTVHQMSKCLQKITVRSTGLKIVDSLVTFAWSHLDHYMDSVRHLTAQMLATVVNYCAKLDREGDDSALCKLLSALKSLDTSRRSYYVSVSCLVSEVGAGRVLHTWPTLIQDVLGALSSQHIQASATVCLESLVSSDARSCGTEELQARWLRPVLEHAARSDPDCTVINILENLLVTAVKLDRGLIRYIIPYIKQSHENTSKPMDLKCVLMLLSVTRKSGASDSLPLSGGDGSDEWRGVIGYEVLRRAAIDAVDEVPMIRY
ncbi:unnamed protein product [Arctia plantaginis]|uniref:Uncharacterized protein n=1 Tax=Arctia plantaginis TaxID=874455 RepID=A0A8S1B355_ARCPL|nr:unnamed protein product [Arctia plantaginis]